MKIVYVLPGASLCGGVKIIGEHITRLAARGHDAEVWHLGGDWAWFPRPVPHRKFPHTDQLGAALQSFSGVKVATFWTTASWVASNLLPGERGYYLVQDEDELTYSGSFAGTSYRLGLVPITEGAFVTESIEKKYGATCHNVGIGIDHRTFRPLPMIREQFRVLTPSRTTSAGPAKLKGWDLAQSSLRELARAEPQSSLVTFGVEPAPKIDWMPHIHIQRPSDRKLRELYSQAGVFLSASRHEGFGLPMLEAMACFPADVPIQARGIVRGMQRQYTGEMVTVRTSRATIRATAEHPFWTNRGWVKASDICTSHELEYTPFHSNNHEVRDACKGLEEVHSGPIGRVVAVLHGRHESEGCGDKGRSVGRDLALAVDSLHETNEDSREAREATTISQPRFHPNGTRLSRRFGGWGGVRHAQENGQKRNMEAGYFYHQYVEGAYRLAREENHLPILFRRQAPRTWEQASILHIQDGRLGLVTAVQTVTPRLGHQAGSDGSSNRVVKASAGTPRHEEANFAPPAGRGDSAAQYERVISVSREFVSNFPVFNLTTLTGTYTVAGYLVHNCGCPVVCTDAGGNREFCRHGETALVCPAQTAGGLASHMRRVLNDTPLAGRLSAAGIAEAQRYQWDHVIDRLEAVFRA